MAKATKAKTGRGNKAKGNGLPNNGKRNPGNGLAVICRVVVTPKGSRTLGTAITLYKGGTVGPYCTRVNVKAGKVVSWVGYPTLPKAQTGFVGIVTALTKAGV